MALFSDTNQNDQVQIPQDVDPIEVLTGPGAKFDRSKYQSETDMWQAIARGKVEGDAFVEHLKARLDESRQDNNVMREQLNAGPKLKELIDRINPQQPQHEGNQVVQQGTPEVDFNKIQELVQAQIQATKQAEKEAANADLVERRLSEHYGPNFQSILKQQIDSMGLTPEFVNNMAKQSPQALFRTLGLDAPKQGNFQAPVSSSVRTDPFSPTTNKRTWSYYQKMRKDNPQLYREPKTQSQMFKDAMDLGSAFEDGDYYTGFKHLS